MARKKDPRALSRRRERIIGAAWRCFQRQGLHATTMQQISKESGLSAGAIYRCFTGKDEMTYEAIGHSLAALVQTLRPLILRDDSLAPLAFINEANAHIERAAREERGSVLAATIHGWSEAQRSTRVRSLLESAYRTLHECLMSRAAHWRAKGLLAPQADIEAVAATLGSIVLARVVQASLADSPEA